MDEPTARRVIRHLIAAGGTDVVLIDGRLYRLTAEQLGKNAPEAAREFMEDHPDAEQ
ncbi:hypothetical protein ACGTNG_12730 [Halomonas sp. 1390]|uniref:hypothetical protein n=1 Tax=Halomonas sp. B23F22_3 TaxID=3459516 RepID=UPI00373F2FAE